MGRQAKKDPHRIDTRKPIDLSKCPTGADDFHDNREAAESESAELQTRLAGLQNRLYAQGTQNLLVVLQAMDAGGKDGTIRRVFRGVNPQGVRVTSFKAPTPEELDHDFLWRIHKAVPGNGMVGVFNRSHYEEVLVVRVHKLVPEKVWRGRYDQINDFEKLLTDTGTRILKFYLHISKDEQKERFQDRLKDREKNWKFAREDLDKRKFWKDYMKAFEELLEKCSPKHAPWYIIPADQKWYRNLAILRVLVATLEDMNPTYPPAEEGLESIVVK